MRWLWRQASNVHAFPGMSYSRVAEQLKKATSAGLKLQMMQICLRSFECPATSPDVLNQAFRSVAVFERLSLQVDDDDEEMAKADVQMLIASPIRYILLLLLLFLLL